MMEAHTVLIVDDEDNVLKSLARLLEDENCVVATALSGKEALEILKSVTPSIIISDYRMPHMNGVEFLLESRRIFPDTIRIMLTGFADIDAVIGAINQGEIYRYITKPWKEDELRAIIRDCLIRYELVSENRYLLELTVKQNEELKNVNAALESKVEERTKELKEKNQTLQSLYEKLDKSFVETVKIILKTFAIKNEKLGIHAKRVASIAVAMAENMGLRSDEVRDIEIAGLFHDIGKVNMPSFILFRSENLLSHDQKAILRQHPVMGNLALSGIERLKTVSDLVLYHHEQLNGGGYPYHKKEEEIPLGAQVIAVANTFENLISGAIIGEKHLSPEDALKEIQSREKRAFSPTVVKSLQAVMGIIHPESKPNMKMKVTLDELKEGMLLATHLHTQSGILIMTEGDIITADMIGRLKQYAQIEPLREDIIVYESRSL